MERVDAFVALAGALVLAGAVGAAALQSGPGGASHDVFPVLVPEKVAFDMPTHQPGEAFRDETAFELNRTGLHLLAFNVSVEAFPAFLSAGSARVVVTAPNGSTWEAEMDAAQGASRAVAALLVPVEPLPEPRAVAVAPGEGREAAFAAYRPPRGVESWTVAVDYAPGALAPGRVEASVEVDVLRWEPRTADAQPPPAK